VITPPPSQSFENSAGIDLAISPDGKRIVYVAASGDGVRHLFVQPIDGREATPISEVEGMLYTPFFSPDGESVAFFAESSLKTVPISGGPPTTLWEFTSQHGGSWGPDDTIVFAGTTARGQGLYRLSAAGGKPEILAVPDREKGELQYRQPEVLPGGKAVLFTMQHADGSFPIAVWSSETGATTVLFQGGREVRYASTGHLVYEAARTGNLMAVPFDLESLKITGDPVSVLEGVRQSPDSRVDYTLSLDGTLAYVPSGGRARVNLVWVDREGNEQQLTKESRTSAHFRLSPDGRRVVLGMYSQGSRDIWVYDVERGTYTQITDGGENMHPIWTPDGARVTFNDELRNLYWRSADGSGEVEEILVSENEKQPTSWSPDGRILAFEERDPDTGWNIAYVTLEGDRTPTYLVSTPFNEQSPMISPDGRWLAYISEESGQDEVYVQPFPGGGERRQISTRGGMEPIWSQDGRELFYRNGDRMMAVAVETEPGFSAGVPRLLFEGRYILDSHPRYGVSPDGQRFLLSRLEGETQIKVVPNWFEELKGLVSAN
jgi:serine/threonine-protein kinase